MYPTFNVFVSVCPLCRPMGQKERWHVHMANIRPSKVTLQRRAIQVAFCHNHFRQNMLEEEKDNVEQGLEMFTASPQPLAQLLTILCFGEKWRILMRWRSPDRAWEMEEKDGRRLNEGGDWNVQDKGGEQQQQQIWKNKNNIEIIISSPEGKFVTIIPYWFVRTDKW